MFWCDIQCALALCCVILHGSHLCNTETTSVCLSACLSVTMISRLRAFQPSLAVWVERLGHTTSRTPGLVPRRAVTGACYEHYRHAPGRAGLASGCLIQNLNIDYSS